MARKQKKGHGPGSVETRIEVMVSGLQALPVTASLDVAGTGSVSSQLVTELTQRRSLYVTADMAHQALSTAIGARNVAEPETIARLDAIEVAVKSHLGESNPALVNFGLTPKKPARTLTPEQKQHKVAASRATRAARKAASQAEAPVAGSVPPPVTKT